MMKRFPATTTLQVIIYLLAAQVLNKPALGQEESVQQYVHRENLAVQEAKIGKLVLQLRDKSIDDDSKTALKRELSALLLEQFTLMESFRRQQIEAIERRIEQVKATLDMRSKNAETIVESRISQLLNEPSQMNWNFTLPLNDLPPLLSAPPSASSASTSKDTAPLDLRDLRLDGLLTDPKPKKNSQEGKVSAEINPDLLLGYGLALSNIDGKRKELAEIVKEQRVIADQIIIAREASYNFSKALEGKNRNDPNLNSQYERTIADVASKMEQYEKLTSLISQKNREIAILEMRLLPLIEEVNKAYPSDSPKVESSSEQQGLSDPKAVNPPEIK